MLKTHHLLCQSPPYLLSLLLSGGLSGLLDLSIFTPGENFLKMTSAFLDRLHTLKKFSTFYGYSLFLDYGLMHLSKLLPNLYSALLRVCGIFQEEALMDTIDLYLDLSIEYLDIIWALLLLEHFCLQLSKLLDLYLNTLTTKVNNLELVIIRWLCIF